MGISISFQFKKIMDFNENLSKIPLQLMMLNNSTKVVIKWHHLNYSYSDLRFKNVPQH
jgi:hypothetical protein